MAANMLAPSKLLFCSDELNGRVTNKARGNVIPEASKSLYEMQYRKFSNWCLQMDITVVDEPVLLAYFQLLSESMMASTLWTIYTKIKSMLFLKRNIDISKYTELQCFLKRKQKCHSVKKSDVFTSEEIKKFLQTAPDEKFLLHKVSLLIGLHGCLKSNELLNLRAADVQRQGSVYCVHVRQSKTGVPKTFYTAEMSCIIEKYVNLRPPNMERFLVQFKDGKCARQNMGRTKLSGFPRDVANFLGLQNPSDYTGHAIRRTSATLIVDQGADLLTLKRHGVCQSNTIAEHYIDDSYDSKLIQSAVNIPEIGTATPKIESAEKTAVTQQDIDELKSITQSEYLEVLTSNFNFNDKGGDNKKKEKQDIPNLIFKNCSNVNINFYNK